MNDNERKIKALLNLKEIKVGMPDTFSSSACGARCFFSIECETEHGYAEDPDFGDVVFKVLTSKREGDEVILSIKAKIRDGEG